MIARRGGLALAVLMWLVSVPSCSITRPSIERHLFTIEVSGAAPADAVRIPATLKVGRISMEPPYGGTSFMYRIGALQYEADYYNGFVAAPNELLGLEIARWLRGAGLFAAVREPASPLTGDYVLDGLVTELYGDLRNSEDPAAVLAIRVYLRRADAQGALVFEHMYSQRVPIGNTSPEALAHGYGVALGQVMTKLERDLVALGLAK